MNTTTGRSRADAAQVLPPLGYAWGLRLRPFGLWAGTAINDTSVVAPRRPLTEHARIVQISTFLITTALAGMGLSLPLSDLRRAEVRPLLMGALLWLLVASSSLGLQALTHTL